MNNLYSGSPLPVNQSIPNQEEVKLKYEEELKENALPFDIVKAALSSLSPEITLSPSALREKISNVLAHLIDKDDSILKNLPSKENNPLLHKSISSLVDIYKQIKNADSITDVEVRGNTLIGISEKLLKAGDIDKAIEVANAIPDAYARSEVISSISKALMKNNETDKAIEAANTLDNPIRKAFILWGISMSLKALGNFEKASEVTKAARDNINLLDIRNIGQDREFRPAEVAHALAIVGDNDEALIVANRIRPAEWRDITYKNISLTMAANGDTDKAFEVAKLINNQLRQEEVLETIIDALLKVINTPNLEKASEIANTLSDASKSFQLRKIQNILNNATSGG
jgi:tetratricopeptide (TPR) repeat protein